MRKNCMPAVGVCPHCAGEFLVTGRTGDRIGSLLASDVLEWRCVSCQHAAKEIRHLMDGVDGDWPVSKFARTPAESVERAPRMEQISQILKDEQRTSG